MKKSTVNLRIDSFECREVVHRGQFSITYRAYNLSDKRFYLLKTLNDEYLKEDESIYFIHSYNMSTIIQQSEHLINPLDIRFFNNTLFILYEDFMPLPLSKIAIDKEFSLFKKMELSVKLVYALKGVHNSKVIHKNIHLDNILYDEKSEKICIIDFGFSSFQLQKTVPLPFLMLNDSVEYFSPDKTGFINDSFDYRSDYYSLGVTLYELFTGVHPYTEMSTTSQIFPQLSHPPIAPHKINPLVNPALSKIILRLMEKDPEQSYRSTDGILWDLEQCLDFIQGSEFEKLEDFTLGTKDVYSQLVLSSKIYGREQESNDLLEKFIGVCNGYKQCLFITGRSGIGKTALIRKIYSPLIQSNGIFVSGKFDKLQRDIPFSAIIHAMSKVIRFVLAEPQEQRDYWTEQILRALQGNGKLIIDVLPNLEELIGSQSPLALIDHQAAQERFIYGFRKFITCFAKQKHPLVMFLDDLQWADPASLDMIQLLLNDPELKYCYILGAYRDNEITPQHALYFFLDYAKSQYTFFNVLKLQELNSHHLYQLINDTLQPTVQCTQQLAETILNKTQGNPFFTRELIKYLYCEHIIYFSPQSQTWCWKKKFLQNVEFSDEVDLLRHNFKNLSSLSRKVLHVAACIGHIFYLEDVAKTLDQEAYILVDEVTNLQREGFIEPLADAYRLSCSNLLKRFDLSKFCYKFSHDRIQQAAYSIEILAESNKIHLKIGELLYAKLLENKDNKLLFSVVSHYQHALGLKLSKEQKQKIQESFSQASIFALERGSPHVAEMCALNSLELLSSKKWMHNYKENLALYTYLSTAFLLQNKYSQLYDCVNTIKHQARSIEDTYIADLNYAKGLMSEGNNLDSLNYLARQLKHYGINLPNSPKKLSVLIHFFLTYRRLLRAKPDKVEQLPLLMNSDKDFCIQGLLRLYSRSASRARNEGKIKVLLGASHQIDHSLNYGVSVDTAIAYQWFAVAYMSLSWNVGRTCYLSSFADRIVERFDPNKITMGYTMMRYSAIEPWIKPLDTTLSPLKKGYIQGMYQGDSVVAASCLNIYCFHLFLSDSSLPQCLKETKKSSVALSTSVFVHYFFVLCLLEVIEGFQKINPEPWLFKGRYAADDDLGRILSEVIICYEAILMLKIKMAYCFENYAIANKYIEVRDAEIGLSSAYITAPWVLFYRSLTYLEIYQDHNFFKKLKYLKVINKDIKKLKKIAQENPHNFAPLYAIAFAVQLSKRCSYTHEKKTKTTIVDVQQAFSQAIDITHKYGASLLKGLVNELFAKHYMRTQQKENAYAHLHQAIEIYKQWGAANKIHFIKDKYPEIEKFSIIKT